MGKEKIIINSTRKTPSVLLDRGRIEIGGRSIPEDSNRFYQPIYNWVKENFEGDITPTKVDLNFEYINTSSTKWVFAVIKELGMNTKLIDNLEINWFYEEGDNDMEELGYILKSMVPCRFRIVETEE